jgi:hypothetical protein
MATYIVRIVGAERIAQMEIRVALEGETLVAVYHGETGMNLFADFLNATGKRGDTVRNADGTTLAGNL